MTVQRADLENKLRQIETIVTDTKEQARTTGAAIAVGVVLFIVLAFIFGRQAWLQGHGRGPSRGDPAPMIRWLARLFGLGRDRCRTTGRSSSSPGCGPGTRPPRHWGPRSWSCRGCATTVRPQGSSSTPPT